MGIPQEPIVRSSAHKEGGWWDNRQIDTVEGAANWVVDSVAVASGAVKIGDCKSI